MSWIDLVLVLLLAVFISLGAYRRLSGFLLGVAGALGLPALLTLGRISPILAVATALGAGLVIAIASRWVARSRPLPGALFTTLGGVGGGLLGILLILGTSVAMPLGRNTVGQLVYPAQELPAAVSGAVQRSLIVRQGREILLYPLLERQGDIPESRRPALRFLHSYLVVGEPWEEER